MRISRRFLAAAAVTMLIPTGLALADPVFGPQTFEAIGDTDTLYDEVVPVDTGGPYALFIRNGDDESSRVDEITVAINGDTVFATGDLAGHPAGARRAVSLSVGGNELSVALSGAPGSFVTIAIVPPDELPVFAAGRLLLPWGRDDAALQLALALRNGSPRFPRVARVVFFRPDGSVAAATPRFPIAPHGSAAASATELLAGTDWNVGSVAVFWAGPGTARLFGSARQVGPGVWDAEPMQQAGYHLFRAAPAHDADSRRSRFDPR